MRVKVLDLWEALEGFHGSEDALIINGHDGSTAHAWCPACGSRPARELDLVVVDDDVVLWPRCGCDPHRVVRALELEPNPAKLAEPPQSKVDQVRCGRCGMPSDASHLRSMEFGGFEPHEAWCLTPGCGGTLDDFSPLAPDGQSDPGRELFPLLTVRDLAELPEPSWLIDGLVAARAFNVLYGPSGIGKSFAALDWAMCVASGLAWYGRACAAGDVVYVAAEGAGGLHRRVNAWQTARQREELERIRFLPSAVNFLDARELDRARRTLDQLAEPPVMIVVDTMARTMVGGDENAARDVGLFIDAIDTLRDETAAALVVHHTGKSGDDERGSSALRGAADLMAALKPDGASLKLECTKAKDSEPFDPWTLHLDEVAESCVLRLGSNRDALSDDEHAILECLPRSFGSNPTPSTSLQRASGVAERTFYRARQSLIERGFLTVEKHGRSAICEITDDGQAAIAVKPANTCPADDGIPAATAGSLGPAGGRHPEAPSWS